MPTDKTPRDADETLALPVTDEDRTTATDDTAVLPQEPDTAVLPTAADTTALPATAADDTAVIEPDAAVDETRPLPVTDQADPYPSTSAWSSPDEPAPYTSPIGALYAPADRPDQGPTDQVAPEPAPVADPAPADPPRRRLRVGTVVWGLVIAAIGVGLLAWSAGFAIDLQLAMIVLLAVAGTALLVGSIVSGARAARR